MLRKRSSTIVALVFSAILIATSCAGLATTNPPPGATGASPGCGTTTQGGTTDRADTVTVEGATRNYTITVPNSHVAGTTTPIPLVLDFHGLIEGLATTHPGATQFSPKAQANNFAVAYPIGQLGGINWDISLSESNQDLKFIDALVAKLGSTLCLDRSRIYITGLSYGAFFTSTLMCMRANTFAAAAPVAGIQNDCTATTRKVPVVTFHGDADPILPYGGFSGTPQAIATKYGCQPTPTVTTLTPNPDPVTGKAITKSVWNCGSASSAVEFYSIGGGGHSWPGSAFFSSVSFIVGPTASSLNATDVIWDFFKRFHL